MPFFKNCYAHPRLGINCLHKWSGNKSTNKILVRRVHRPAGFPTHRYKKNENLNTMYTHAFSTYYRGQPRFRTSCRQLISWAEETEPVISHDPFIVHLSTKFHPTLCTSDSIDTDVLEIQVNELEPVVDKIFIMESTRTHSRVSQSFLSCPVDWSAIYIHIGGHLSMSFYAFV